MLRAVIITWAVCSHVGRVADLTAQDSDCNRQLLVMLPCVHPWACTTMASPLKHVRYFVLHSLAPSPSPPELEPCQVIKVQRGQWIHRCGVVYPGRMQSRVSQNYARGRMALRGSAKPCHLKFVYWKSSRGAVGVAVGPAWDSTTPL